MPRRARRAALLAAALTAALVAGGCTALRWIAGAPSASEARAAVATSPLVARRCANCHEAPDPAAMSAEAWRAALERMKVRVRLPAAEWDTLEAMARPRDDGR